MRPSARERAIAICDGTASTLTLPSARARPPSLPFVGLNPFVCPIRFTASHERSAFGLACFGFANIQRFPECCKAHAELPVMVHLTWKTSLEDLTWKKSTGSIAA